MRRRRTARTAMAAVAGAVVTLLALIGCSAPGETAPGPRFVTSPLIHFTSVLWPVPLELVGVEPGSRLRLVASMTTARGRWSSEATYTVPASGTLDLAQARPQLAPFTRPDSAGLFWSLRGPALTTSAQIELWMNSTAEVTIDAVDGARVVASRVFRLDGIGADEPPRIVTGKDLVEAEAAATAGRPLPRPGPLPPGSPESGPVGDFYRARSTDLGRSSAVVVFDDTSPGASSDFVAPLLAAFGSAVLVLPSGGATGGFGTAGVINAATVSAALHWLVGRGDIDPDRVYVYGTGPAEQFALWAATRYSDRISGVFGAGGSSALLCLPGSDVSSVFENGIGTPCQADAGRVDPAAVFPLDEVNGPVVLGCAERDAELLNACLWLDAARARRGAARAGDAFVHAAGAAHPITVPPGLPIDLGDRATAESTERGRVAFWDAVARVLLREGRT